MRQFMKGERKNKQPRKSLLLPHRAGGYKPPPLPPPPAVSICPTLHSLRHSCSTSEAGLKHTAQLRLALLSPGVGGSVVFKKFSHVDPSWPTVPAPDNFSDALLKSSPTPTFYGSEQTLCLSIQILQIRDTLPPQRPP